MSIKLNYRSNFRGIRKCPGCSKFNGYRATYCKNASCQLKLRDEANTGRKVSASQAGCVVQLLPDYARLYSVWLRPGKRNFIETSIGENGAISALTIPLETTSVGVEAGDIEAITRLIAGCKTTAEPLPLHKSAVESLTITETAQASLWEKQSQCTGSTPLVQRLGPDIFVVGHWPQSSHGLCHVVALRRNQKYAKLTCDCTPASERKGPPVTCWHMLAVVAGLLSASKTSTDGGRWEPLLQSFVKQTSPTEGCRRSNAIEFLDEPSPSASSEILNEELPIAGQRIEMFDCILNTAMMELFCEDVDVKQELVSLSTLADGPTDGPIVELAIGDARSTDSPTMDPYVSDMLTSNAESLHLMDCQIELMDEFDPTDRIDFCPSDIECDESILALPAKFIDNLSTKAKTTLDDEPEAPVEVTAKKSALRQSGRVEKGKLTRGSYSVRKLLKALESNGVIFNRIGGPSGTDEGDTHEAKKPDVVGYEATLCSLSFTRWLESVIEQLNGSIDYNKDGKPEPQTFRIHEDFFRCLRARFSVGHSLRQPEKTHPTDTVESLPGAPVPRSQVFRFSHHKSLQHVFRTDRVQLCFEKSFVRSSDGERFVAYDLPEDLQELASSSSLHPIGGQPTRAHCYSTYIKIGRYKHEPDPDRVYHFSLEWIGNVLPRSGFGDLRIMFEYGHRKNNRYVPPPAGAVVPDANAH